MKTTKLQHVKLSNIEVSTTNEMFRDPTEMTPEALHELVESIRNKGVIQPVLLRPVAGRGYELICGERRYQASKVLGLETIPANIREMSDQEAFECQVTENLQRKDVHPLREARAYHYLVERDPAKNTPEELAIKFGKSPHYIATRLKLNDLVPEVRNDFAAGRMSLAGALAIARLQPEDQMNVKEHCQNDYWGSEEGSYGTTSDIEDFIESNVICSLNAAAFSKEDENLVPGAGPCTTCNFRSGANQLFADIDDKDRCFKRTCFAQKKEAHAIRVLTETIEEKPDIVLLRSYGDELSESVNKTIQEHKLTVLKEYTHFYKSRTHGYSKMQGLWVSGPSAGRIDTVYVEQARQKTTTSKVENSTTDAINQINDRLERARDLDADKVYHRIVNALHDHPNTKEVSTGVMSAERVLMAYILFKNVRYDLSDAELKAIRLPRFHSTEKAAEIYDRMSELTDEQLTFLLRKVMVKKFCTGSAASLLASNDEAIFIRKVAESYGDIPIETFESEQAAIREKREANAKKRIEALKKEAETKNGKAVKKSKTTVTA